VVIADKNTLDDIDLIKFISSLISALDVLASEFISPGVTKSLKLLNEFQKRKKIDYTLIIIYDYNIIEVSPF
jgi:hypothetical protein